MEGGGWFKALPIFRTTRNKIGPLRSAYDCPTSVVINGYKGFLTQSGFKGHLPRRSVRGQTKFTPKGTHPFKASMWVRRTTPIFH